jgi:hypothetical protein
LVEPFLRFRRKSQAVQEGAFRIRNIDLVGQDNTPRPYGLSLRNGFVWPRA